MLEVAVGASSDGAQLWEKKLQHQEGKQEHIVLCVVSVEVWPKCFWFSLILLICVSTYKLFGVLNQKKKLPLFHLFFQASHLHTGGATSEGFAWRIFISYLICCQVEPDWHRTFRTDTRCSKSDSWFFQTNETHKISVTSVMCSNLCHLTKILNECSLKCILLYCHNEWQITQLNSVCRRYGNIQKSWCQRGCCRVPSGGHTMQQSTLITQLKGVSSISFKCL